MFSCVEFCELHQPLVGSGLCFFLCIPDSFIMTLHFVSQSISPLSCSASVEDGDPSPCGVAFSLSKYYSWGH
jgi:hypothetical protein